MRKPVRVAVLGAGGRMGQRLVALLAESRETTLAAALDRSSQPDSIEHIDVLIDFSAPLATSQWLKICRQRGVPMVIGTTNLKSDELAAIDSASGEIPILQSPNMSAGVAVLIRLAEQAAAQFGTDSDVAITESHHRFKVDAPSGTAKLLAEAIERAAHVKPTIHAIRLGDEIGRHTIHLANLGERIELSHVATNRDVFARGALRAAAWLVRQKPGRYTMADVLGLK